MSRELVNYETGVSAPDGYREQWNEYIYFCDECGEQRETTRRESHDLCEDCLLAGEGL